MALDEALLESVAAHSQPPTLRLYQWEPECLSLGHAQPAQDVDLERVRALGWDLVRRTTGGRAILHAEELTYSVTAPIDHPLVAGGVLPSYCRLSEGLLTGLRVLGVEADTAPGKTPPEAERANPVCFEAPSAYEITTSGRKLIGSAQLRRAAGLLQHGSLPLGGDVGLICEGLRYETAAHRAAAADRVRRRATTLEQALGQRLSWQRVADALAEGFARALGVEWVLAAPTDAEQARAHVLRAERFGAEAWTLSGSRG